MMCDVHAFNNLIKKVHRPAQATLSAEEGATAILSPLSQNPPLSAEFHEWYSGEMHT